MSKKRSPWQRHHERERAADAKMLGIILSMKHMCLCGHPSGFHWANEDGKPVGECAPADCDCKAFDEDVLAEARRQAEMRMPAAAVRVEADEDEEDDALLRAMRTHENREVSSDEAWDRALHAKRPNPIGKPRPDVLRDPAAMEALRELGGSPEDLTG
jgi:hypothetical protein